jgi:putative ABC transport system ATP-binding protein
LCSVELVCRVERHEDTGPGDIGVTSMLVLDGVSKIYQAGSQDVVALSNVHAELQPGKMVGVFGPSGSGKTTFLMMAGLVDAPTMGRVIFNGETVATPQVRLNRLRDFRRKNIGFVFQRANLIPFLTAVENVEVALFVNDWPEKSGRTRAERLLDALGLENRRDSFAVQLSGGEQQRVAIARALANNPAMLFADEPTAALDSVRGRDVMTLFRKLAVSQGMAVCVVTHDPRWLELFDSVIEMQDGVISRRYHPGPANH